MIVAIVMMRKMTGSGGTSCAYDNSQVSVIASKHLCSNLERKGKQEKGRKEGKGDLCSRQVEVEGDPFFAT